MVYVSGEYRCSDAFMYVKGDGGKGRRERGREGEREREGKGERERWGGRKLKKNTEKNNITTFLTKKKKKKEGKTRLREKMRKVKR